MAGPSATCQWQDCIPLVSLVATISTRRGAGLCLSGTPRELVVDSAGIYYPTPEYVHNSQNITHVAC